MNERIQELYIKTLSEECSNPALVDIEKFAELIVKECAEVAYKRSVHSCPSDIFKHFGVEE